MAESRTTELVIGCSEPSALRSRALLQGEVAISFYGVRLARLGPGEMLLRAFADPELNVAELSLSNFIARTARRDNPYAMLPVYLLRGFPHGWFHARTDRGIASLADLRGKRVGTSGFQRTMNVWARGFLEDEFALRRADIQWVIKDTPDTIEAFMPRDVPAEIVTSNESLSELLESGKIDAMISLHAPDCAKRGVPGVKRVVTDPDKEDADYFDRTGIFPIMHVLGARPALLAENPQLGPELFAAFSKAKEIALRTPGVSQGWRERAWNYGVRAAERKSLEAFLRYHATQGLSGRQIPIEELFAPVAMARYGENS